MAREDFMRLGRWSINMVTTSLTHSRRFPWGGEGEGSVSTVIFLIIIYSV
jgi:hypothetical protein